MLSSIQNKTVREELLQRLKESHAFWSYNPMSITPESIPDELLIEKVLVHLDVEDINRLFLLFSEKKVKEVWKSQLIPQDSYYHGLNKLQAYAYFGIRNPNRYIKEEGSKYIRELKKQSNEWFSKTYGGDI